jgi:histidyl-tRNA synthetase
MGKKDKQELVKAAKGTRDYSDNDIDVLDDILAIIERVVRKHAGKKLVTPAFEREEVLKGKYGEDSKLIYDLKDQGGELLSLRYDLTVPFARWLGNNANVSNYKRLATDKVWRRDQPAIAKGRLREFYQCDIDFAGASDPMLADAEILKIVVEVFEKLEWKNRYVIKINDRRILDGMFEVCGVPEDKIRSISSAVDKLDKAPWEEVRQEMVEIKGLAPEIADKIKGYVMLKGSSELAEKLQKDEVLMANPKAKLGIEEMSKLFEYLEDLKVLDKVSFDLSLARGLDYYTGIIYEVRPEESTSFSAFDTAVSNGATTQSEKPKQDSKKKEKKPVAEDEDRSDDPTVSVGSIAAGGRYDNLVGRFRPNATIPCVGVSFGVNRIFAITQARMAKGEKFSYISDNTTEVYVMAFGSDMTRPRLKVLNALWEADLTAEWTWKNKPKPNVQYKFAETGGASLGVILGEEEAKNGELRIKRLGVQDEKEKERLGELADKGIVVKMADVGKECRRLLDEIKLEQKTQSLSLAA